MSDVINTDVSGKSWNSISPEDAKTYLHYYPREMKEELGKVIKTSKPDAKILDIGCGNAQLYTILNGIVPEMKYTGVDSSGELLRVARSVVGDDGTIIQDDLFKFLSTNKERYDFSVLSHMLECIESPEMAMCKCAEISTYIAIHWFDPPVYEYDVTNIGKNPHSQDEFKPYIRRRMGKDYWNMIINKAGLKLVHHKSSGPKNLLEIYAKK